MEQNYSKVFETLNKIDCSAHTETKKQGATNLTYLSWAWAWAEVKKAFPNATFTIYENAQGWNYHTDGRTAWVKTGVTIEGVEMIEYLPVMDFRNQSIPLENVTSFDVNKAIQRSLTKAAARHGLGLYIYAGEDLPEDSCSKPAAKPAAPKKTAAPAPVPDATTPEQKKLATANTKAELRAMLTDNHWVANKELVNYATLLAQTLPD
jgi:hypothetical protein